MPSLQVWLRDQHVATLATDRRGRMSLVFEPEIVSSFGEGTPLLSVALPASSKPSPRQVVEAWVEGLLPEGEIRTALERLFNVKRGDSFGLLSELGRDCAGAVVIIPADQGRPEHGEPIPMTEDDVRSALESLPQHPLGADTEVRVSLGGLQSKLLLVRQKHGWARPAGGTPSTHILKPEPAEHPGLVAAEAFAQLVAALAGLNAARAEPVLIGDRPVLVVERFDRELVNGQLVRTHQEDACQALGLDPRMKYQTASGPGSYRSIANVLSIHAEDPQHELNQLGKMMAFTVAIGNTDAHLRNHALLHSSGTVALAPIYDAAPTVDFVRTRQVALWVRDQPMLSAITAVHLIDEMASWGLRGAIATEVVHSTLDALREAIPSAAASIQNLPEGIEARSLRRVEQLLRA